MKSFKLSLVLLTTLFALQTFTTDAFFGNAFARFAAFGKSQTAIVKSFFNTQGRTLAAKAAANKKAILLPGFVVAGSVAAWQGKKLIPTAKAEGAEVAQQNAQQKLTNYEWGSEESKKAATESRYWSTNCFSRYMVAQAENLGVAKQEKCTNIYIKFSGTVGQNIDLSMECPKRNQELDVLYHKALDSHRYDQLKKSQVLLLKEAGDVSLKKNSPNLLINHLSLDDNKIDRHAQITANKDNYHMSGTLPGDVYNTLLEQLNEEEAATKNKIKAYIDIH
jgi:hypothetical protein